jgi:NodT family efflux transporter outer membrane factor (OMF) lipoprotein
MSSSQFPFHRLAAVLIGGALLALLVCGGCRKVGPDFSAPKAPVPDMWYQDVAAEFSTAQPAIQAWWNNLDDPVLAELIRKTREQNLTLRQAVSVIRQARAQRGATARLLQPSVNLNAVYSAQRPSEQAPPLSLLPEDIRDADNINLLSPGLDMAWEIDVFGRVRRTVEAADAALQASVEGYRDILVTLFGEVALAYVDLRTLQRRLAYADSNIQLQQRALDLARTRFETGLTGRLDLEQARANLANTQALIPSLRLAIQSTLNRSAFLLSQQPGSVHADLSTPSPIPSLAPKTADLGLPAGLVRQRPDIRRAERTLAAQTARIGVLTADLYPRFGLSGNLSLATADITEWRSAGTFAITPFLQWNVFNRGRIRDNIRAQEEATKQALYAYENTVLQALFEVETSMVALREEKLRRDALLAGVEALTKAAELVEILYTTGLSDFQNVLDTQRFLFQQQDALAVSEGQVTRNAIALYKALGGGWAENEVTPGLE